MCPYVGGDLSKMFTESTTDPPTRRMMRDVAEGIGEAWTEAARQHTPRETGRLASRWRTLPVEKTPEGYTSGTENPDFRALLVEYGVEDHTLRPRHADALDTPEGPRANAEHPGHDGAHMLAKSAHEIDATWPSIAQPHLSRWAADVERNAKRHPGID